MLKENLKNVQNNIKKACERVGRKPEEVTLVAVSKMKPLSDIEELLETGQLEYGENYVQELCDKYENISKPVHWHMIGHLQTNKVKYIVDKAELIHSDVLSFDSCVSMREAREHLKKHALMGNVSTWTLEFGQPEKVEQLAVKCWKDGSNIISPACGLGTKSPLTNIQAIRHGIMEEAANV